MKFKLISLDDLNSTMAEHDNLGDAQADAQEYQRQWAGTGDTILILDNTGKTVCTLHC